MKIALQIPDLFYRRMEAAAAIQRRTIEAFVNEAIAEKLRKPVGSAPPGWMRGFGQLRHLRRANRRIRQLISKEFSRINPQDRK